MYTFAGREILSRIASPQTLVSSSRLGSPPGWGWLAGVGLDG
jgi:hypothetical protein